MKIAEIIEIIKKHSGDTFAGRKIEEESTRDKILYGDPDQECTGVICTCYASPDVIKQAGEMGCNFIIVHESLFWNHGDHTDWLADNTAFQKKKALLDQYGICIWRFHDYIHAGLEEDGKYVDGIFGGMARLLGWDEYLADEDRECPRYFVIPETTVSQLARLLNDTFGLKGLRFIGNPAARIRRVYIPMHIMGRQGDSELISKINREQINCLLTMEMVDFTVCEYMRDAAMLGEDRCIFALGHFNLEEIGMRYFAEYLRGQLADRAAGQMDKAAGQIPVKFIPSGDAYSYIAAE